MIKQRSMHNIRSASPNVSRSATSTSSVHSEHLWQSLQDLQLYPAEVHELLKGEQRNLCTFKSQIQRQKQRVNQAIQNAKRQVVHNIDDLKISLFAELDRIYKIYMQKYAHLKGQIMQIKHLHDEVEIDLTRKAKNIPTKAQSKITSSSITSKHSNLNVVRSLEQGLQQMKKYHVLNYIAELQKEKILPLQVLSRQLVIMTEYQNGFFDKTLFEEISKDLLISFKQNLARVYERKYEFMRDPESLMGKDEQPILEGIYEPEPTKDTRKVLDLGKSAKVGASQQAASYDSAEQVRLVPQISIKSDSNEIILCALETQRGQIAVGGKEGTITIYQANTGLKMAVLRGHKASICTMAVINHQGKQYLASGSDHGCSSVALWDTTSWTMKMKLQGHKAAVTAIVDLEDGQSIVSGSYDKRINVYNLISGRIAYNLPTNKSSVTGIVLNCKGSKMISCGLDNTLNVWQIVRGVSGLVETMFLQRIIQNSSMICSLVGSVLHEDVIYIGTKDGKLKLINVERGEAYKTISCSNNALIETLVLERQSHPRNPLILCWPCKEECLKIVNTETGRISSIPVEGYIEFGCGIGPKGFFLRSGKTMAMLSQSETHKQITLFKMEAG